jgi:hydrogenase expression/formation protein HypC
MCLAIPGRVIETHREHDLLMGKVDFGGVGKRVCLEYVPDAKVGDYVLVHVGFALARVDEEEAGRIFQMLEGVSGLEELRDVPLQSSA